MKRRPEQQSNRSYAECVMVKTERSSGCQIHFYGERGLVNGLFLDLRDGGGIVDFLRKIEFTFREQTHLDLPDGIEVVVIVEAGFAEFGWPDAILVATTPNAKKLVFFLEAKAGLYQDEAQDYTNRDAGFNSTINGQFSLRYRLVRALQELSANNCRLVEPQTLADAYGEQNPIRLSKPENMQHIVRSHLVNASDYFFVALTDDEVNVWPGLEANNPKRLPFLAECTPKPSVPLEAAWSPERNAWPTYRRNFGWIGFRRSDARNHHGIDSHQGWASRIPGGGERQHH
jgi:hypothetical protein